MASPQVPKSSKDNKINSVNAKNNLNPYFIPPIDIVQTWNTKRLLPHILLSQYTPFAVLFLIDDQRITPLKRSEQGLADSTVLGGPTDTLLGIDKEYLSDPTNYEAFQSPQYKANNLISTTQYVKDSIKDGTFNTRFIKGIKAKIKGYCCTDCTFNLIPLTLKFSQLVHPEQKGIVEISNIQLSTGNIYGFQTGSLSLVCNDITQMFSFKSIFSSLFQNFSRYLLVFGWQGPAIENIDLTEIKEKYGITNSVITGTNSLSITLLDGNQYSLYLPSPFVKNDGFLNLPQDTEGNYIFDSDDTDHGNRVVLPIYGVQPKPTLQYPKVNFSLQFSSAQKGVQFYKPIVALIGGANFEVLRSQIIERINNKTKPVAFYNIASFFDINGSFDADTEQAVAEAFYNSIAASKGAGELIKSLSTNPIEVNEPTTTELKKEEDKKTNAEPIKKERKKTTSSTSVKSTSNIPKTAGISDFDIGISNTIDLPTSQNIQTSSSQLASIAYILTQSIGDRESRGYRGNEIDSYGSGNTNDNGTIGRYQFLSSTLEDALRDYNFKKGTAYNKSDFKNNPQVQDAVMYEYTLDQLTDFYYNNSYTKGDLDKAIRATTINHIGWSNVPRGDINNKIHDKNTGGGEPANTYADNVLKTYNESVKGNTNLPKLGSVTRNGDNAPQVSDINQPTNEDINNILLQQEEERKAAQDAINAGSQNTDINKNELTTGKDSSGKIIKYPAAYRLGDIISACIDVFDNLIEDQNENSFSAMKKVFEKKGLEEIEIGNKKVKVKDIKETDVYGADGDLTQTFKETLKKNGLLSSDDSSSMRKLQSSSCYEKVAKILGYFVISADGKDEKGTQFIQLLNHFKDISAGSRLTEVEEKTKFTSFPLLLPNINSKIFSWDDKYRSSFSGTMPPISVADLPVSVDTVARILQGIPQARSAENLVNQILTAVSLDYGFSLRVFHRTPGSISEENKKMFYSSVQLEVENQRSSVYDTSQIPSEKDKVITLIIDDEFLTQNNTIDLIKNQQSNLSSQVVKNTSTLANQWNLVTPTLTAAENQNLKDFIDMQKTILENEYSVAKLNASFIVDVISSLNLTSQAGFDMMDNSQYGIASQMAQFEMYKGITGINGLNTQIEIPKDKRGVTDNFSTLHNRITSELVTKYKLMPGKKDFEIKYLKYISELFDELTLDEKKKNNDLTFLDDEVIENIRSSIKKDGVIDSADRKKFIAQIVGSYLYNRPMGVKYAFYLGKGSFTIHGTSGLAMGHGIYVRGIIEQNDGIYLLKNVTHTVDLQNGGWKTSFDSGLVQTITQLEANKTIKDIFDKTRGE